MSHCVPRCFFVNCATTLQSVLSNCEYPVSLMQNLALVLADRHKTGAVATVTESHNSRTAAEVEMHHQLSSSILDALRPWLPNTSGLLLSLLAVVLTVSQWVCCEAAVKSALLVVDMQGCFLPGGPLAVSGDVGPVLEAINGLKLHGGFDRVVWTQDWHPPNHVSFAPTHGKQPQDSLQLAYTCVGNKLLGKGPRLCNMTHLYPNPEESVPCLSDQPSSNDDSSSSSSSAGEQARDRSASSSSFLHSASRDATEAATEATHGLSAAAAALADRVRRFGCPEPVTHVQQVLWPPHCVRYTADARLHPDLLVSPDDLVVRKGWQPFIDAYSAFEDNGKLQSTGLAEQLRQEGIGRVVVTGVALDFCVMWTALDAVAEGFETVLVLDASLPVSAAGGVEAVQQMTAAGVKAVDRAQSLHVHHDALAVQRH